jgi:hypothetical protein
MNATKEALLELKALASQATDNLYRRIGLAVQVLADLDWIATEHAGNDLKAQDALQSEFFRDLGGFLSLGELCAMYRALPQERWAALRYNVAAVHVVYRKLAQPESSRPRPSYKAVAEEVKERVRLYEQQATVARQEAVTTKIALDEVKAVAETRTFQVKQLQSDVTRAREIVEQKETEVELLRRKVKQLEAENATLRKRIAQLEASQLAPV